MTDSPITVSRTAVISKCSYVTGDDKKHSNIIMCVIKGFAAGRWSLFSLEFFFIKKTAKISDTYIDKTDFTHVDKEVTMQIRANANENQIINTGSAARERAAQRAGSSLAKMAERAFLRAI